MEKQTVFIKRYPSKGEFPKVSGEYDTSIGNVCFENVHNKFFNHKGELTLDPEWWLEEIELHSVEEKNKLKPQDESLVGVYDSGFYNGASFILNKLKGE